MAALKVAFGATATEVVIKINGYMYRIDKQMQAKNYEVLLETIKDMASDLLEQMDIRGIRPQLDMGANVGGTIKEQIQRTGNPKFEITQERKVRDNLARAAYCERKRLGLTQPPATPIAAYKPTMPLREQPKAQELIMEYRQLFGFNPVSSSTYKRTARIPRRYEVVFGSFAAFKNAAIDKNLV